MQSLFLVEPNITFQETYLNLIEEWTASGEPFVPWCLGLDCTDFSTFVKALLDRSKGLDLPEGFVPDSTYWLMNEAGRMLGAVNIRHELNETLLLFGGHIGYGIRPSERRKGYATQLLQMSLEKIKVLGVHRVLLTCDKDNVASAKTIVNNGGILENEIETPERVTQRWWITV